MSDEREFMQKMGTDIRARATSSRRAVETESPVESDSRSARGNVGEYSQYAIHPEGYIPSTPTVKSLPPGSYATNFHRDLGAVFLPLTLRTDSLIDFPDTRSAMVVSEIDRFWTLDKKFKQHGFLHKRGFLLFGPAGSGKSCTILLITENLVQRGGVVLHSFCDPKTLLTLIERFRTIEPVRSLLVVLEDIDAIIDQYGEHTLLSVLDGESQVDHIVFVATTNYPERLDPRIINRPSRFDRIVKIDMPNAAARKLYLEKKVGTTTSPDGIDLVKPTSGFSIAHLRELIVGIYCLGNSTASVLERLKKMQLAPKPLTTALEGVGFSVGTDEA